MSEICANTQLFVCKEMLAELLLVIYMGGLNRLHVLKSLLVWCLHGTG